MKVCYVVAMVAEAKPFIERYGIKEVEGFFAPLPCRLYEGEVNGMTLNVVLNGQQNGSDLVGCEAATVATLSAIQRLKPDLIVNSGTPYQKDQKDGAASLLCKRRQPAFTKGGKYGSLLQFL